MTATTPQFQARNISKTFGEFLVLDDISVEVGAGSLVGMIGPNGAGKSTFFAVVSGIENASRGEVGFEGRDITRLSIVERARLGLARTFQIPREFRHLSVFENLAVAAPDQCGDDLLNVFARAVRVRKQEEGVRAEVERVIDFLKLNRVRDEAAGRLSGGQKKLLELGRALMLKPKLMMLDEPFAGVNPVMIEQLSASIKTLREQGMSFLIVEHNIPALSALVDAMYVMDRGRIIASGEPQAVLADAKVRESYLGSSAAECC